MVQQTERARKRARLTISGSVEHVNGRGIPAGRSAVIPTVTPEDARYPDMIRGHGNNRHVASPEAIRIPSTTEQVVEIVEEAVRDGKRIALRSGGYCFANLVFNDESEIIVDLRLMDHVGFDDEREAFVVEPGATLLQIYELLHIGWGVPARRRLLRHGGRGALLRGRSRHPLPPARRRQRSHPRRRGRHRGRAG